MSEHESPGRGPRRALLEVLLAAVACAAVIGYFAGTRTMALPTPVLPSAEAAAGDVAEMPPAPTYESLRSGAHSSPGDTSFESLRAEAPDPAALPGIDDALRQAARRERRTRRAFDGAPPTVPHIVPPASSSAECLACHATGVRVGDRTAPTMSHEPYASCTQCHAPGVAPVPGGSDRTLTTALGNPERFEGLRSQRGDRAFPGAPPTIPHPTFMREKCISCHGPGGVAGLRSTHPWRRSCTQCHAPSAQEDQR